MSVIIDGNLTIEQLVSVAKGKEKVELHPEAVRRINRCRALLEEKIKRMKSCMESTPGLASWPMLF